ncbi:MAG: DNA mismatch repair protein MutL [Verrucomicrobia bacterium ADurb.Bin345]|nr:MAG: DNA mismatch repair protein MutL [Verrucomicrobia bacterium ADurb.Bin345]
MRVLRAERNPSFRCHCHVLWYNISIVTSEKQIRLLPDHVANKIAAGEVVDRPASVVKELLENALDAGASQIDIEVAAGGKKFISVADNGSGMGRDNALLSIERHATSKIRDADDIERVGTLGFRGEALAAIAAVSRFSLTTRTSDAVAGTEVVVAGGKVQDVRETGCPVGTTILVRNLFFNVPARRRFLRADATELAHVRQVFLLYALSHPETGFSLVVDRREAYRLPGGAGADDRLRDLLGAEVFRMLRRVDAEVSGIRVHGFVGLPQHSRGDRTEQYLFINRRPASAPVLSFAVSEAYHTLLPKGRHPILYLHIDMAPEGVDVNVHPAKKEVRFRRPGEVRDAVIAALRAALQSGASDVTAPGSRPEGAPESFVEPSVAPLLTIEDLPSPRAFSYPRLPMVPSGGAPPAQDGAAKPESEVKDSRSSRTAPWSWCRVLGQAGGLYVVLETEEGLVLMDPHAAHERVLYETYMREVLAQHVNSQGLLGAETVELVPEDAERVRENMELLRRMGFGVSEFGGDAFIVDAMPVCLGNAAPAVLLADVAGGLSEGGARGGTEHWAEESIAQAACKAAVKARDHLRLSEIEKLVVDLAGCEMPYTCPHGRPTVIFMSFSELHRKFGRA